MLYIKLHVQTGYLDLFSLLPELAFLSLIYEYIQNKKVKTSMVSYESPVWHTTLQAEFCL